MNIENKILIPFLIISVILMSCFGILSYYNGYSLKMDKEKESAEMLLNYISQDINILYDYIDEKTIIEKYNQIYNKNICIFDKYNNVVSGTHLYKSQEDIFYETVISKEENNKLGWKIYYVIDKKEFYDKLIEEQKYIIIAVIAFILIIVQSSIFIAYNISDPLQRLSQTCKTISENVNETNEYIINYTTRTDEIGQLANSFQSMLNNIKIYTDEILKVKNLNENIVENLPIGIVAYDNNRNVICINSKASNMLSKTGYQNNGMNLQKLLNKAIDNNRLVHDPIKFTNEDNKNMYIDMGVWKLKYIDSYQWGILCTIDDITYQKIMEEKINEGEKHAYTGQLAASLAHEIRNPLAGIRTSIQVISMRLSNQTDVMLCQSIVKEVDRVNMLIEDLLNISRKRESKKTLIDLNNLFEEMLLLYSKIAENNNIVIAKQIQEGINIYADESEIKQILINLINNSIKSITNEGEIHLKSYIDNEEIIILVEDSGIGMNKKEIEDTMKPFYSKSRKTTGLGLTIVSKLLAQNNGKFYILSEEGIGTKIYITFRRTGK